MPSPSDPRDDTILPPWIWLTLCTLSLICLLFISFRRAQSLELYERARNYLDQKVPYLAQRRGVRLAGTDVEARSPLPLARPRPRRSHPSQDDLSDTSSVHSTLDEDNPRSGFPQSPLPDRAFPSRRAYTLDAGPARSFASTAFASLHHGITRATETLGWSTERDARALRGEGERSDGIARAFWGLRKSERTGGIKLGEQEPGRPIRDVEQGLPERAGRHEGGTGRGHSAEASKVSSSTLFDLGGDDDAHDAVELPSQFSLASPGRGTR